MVVTRRELEGLISDLTRDVRDPREGLFGRGSLSWRVNREIALLAGGGRAALLQLAHPYVAHAISEHSPTTRDPAGRFYRTFSAVYAILFGDVNSTVEAARRVHKLHASIRGPIVEPSARFPAGHSYAANDEDALLWVYATLVDTAVKTYSLLIRPLSQGERARYYDESRRFAMLFGLSRERTPPDWDSFQRYFTGVLDSGTLSVTQRGRELASFVLGSPAPIFWPLMASYRWFTAGLLPHPLRCAFDLPSGPAQQIAFWLEVKAARTAIRATPGRLRYFPAYFDAIRRLEGKGPDRVGRWLEHLASRSLPQAVR
jgi:uncharacterized protein (DUF2236 family)